MIRLFVAFTLHTMKRAKRTKNFIVANRRNQQPAMSQYFGTCLGASKPFVTVATGRRFAIIEVDMFTTSCSLDDATQGEMIALLRANSEPDAAIITSILICRTDKIRSERAEKVASKLYALAERTIRQSGIALRKRLSAPVA